VAARFPAAPLIGIAFSLGSNILVWASIFYLFLSLF
jgi:hypothetical protein